MAVKEKQKSLIESAIKNGGKVFGFEDCEIYRGRELTTEDLEAKKLEEETKLSMLRTICLSLRKLRDESQIDNSEYRIFANHHGLNKQGKELSFSVLAKLYEMDVETVMKKYIKALNLIKEEVKNYNSSKKTNVTVE